MKQIILATDSFLKKLIFEKAKLNFIVDPADIDEKVFDNLPLDERVQQLSLNKCKKIAEKHPNNIVIGADTLVAMGENIFGKPKDLNDAYNMAMNFSGKEISVYTGVTLFHPKGEFITELSRTNIKYQKFTKPDLERLFKDNFPTRMATGLGIFLDAPGFTLVKLFKGSYTGALGMPMEIVNKYLRVWVK